jgi:hypothetical protein
VLVSDEQMPGLAPTVETDRLEIETTAFRVTVLSTRLSMKSQNIGRMSIAEGASQPEIAAMRASKFSANSQVLPRHSVQMQIHLPSPPVSKCVDPVVV